MSLFFTAVAFIWPMPATEFTDYTTYQPYPITTTVSTTVTKVKVHHHPRRVRHADPPMETALASYYDLSGTGACGSPAQDGLAFANLSLPCGAKVKFCYNGCVTAVMDDRGPYVSGRLFDLNVNLKDALGCPDLCEVRWATVP